jgi:cell pole-organizing protein PopZ
MVYEDPTYELVDGVYKDVWHKRDMTMEERETIRQAAIQTAQSAWAALPQAEWRPISQETLTSKPVAHQAAGSLSKLMGSMLVTSGATLDDVVRELLKPMLKEWLDANLSAIVEAEVAKEIDRIRRMAR